MIHLWSAVADADRSDQLVIAISALMIVFAVTWTVRCIKSA